jgi:hypothetical protein
MQVDDIKVEEKVRDKESLGEEDIYCWAVMLYLYLLLFTC